MRFKCTIKCRDSAKPTLDRILKRPPCSDTLNRLAFFPSTEGFLSKAAASFDFEWGLLFRVDAQKIIEEVVIPSGLFDLKAHAALATVALEHIERQSA